jgi:hypothetical protein
VENKGADAHVSLDHGTVLLFAVGYRCGLYPERLSDLSGKHFSKVGISTPGRCG